MSYWNRMISSIWAGKRKTIVILCIAIVLSFILLVTISIRSASERSVKKIRSSIETSVSMTTKESFESDVLAADKIEKAKIDEMSKLSNVKYCNYTVRTLATSVKFKPVISAEQQQAMDDKQTRLIGGSITSEEQTPFNVSISADSATKYNKLFTQGYNKMLAGNMIEEKDEHVCLLCYKLASMNNLLLGNTITVIGPTKKKVELKIIGFYGTASYGNMEIFDAYRNTENMIYTDLGSAMEIADSTNLAVAEFKMKDPVENENFVQQVLKIDPENKDDYVFAFNDTTYKLLSSSLQMLITITTLVLIGAIFLGGIILTLLVAISMRDRDYEIGILLAMGEKKYKIILQMIGEVLLPIIVGACIGTIVTLCLNGVLNHMVATTMDVKVNSSIWSVLKMLGGTILLNLVGAILTIYKVIRYQPKEILMHIE